MQNSQPFNKKFIAAAIIERDGKILIARRADQSKCHPGKWEFPGGKVEAGETLQECLKRELFEELGIHAEVGEYFCTSTFYHKDVLFDMCVFKVPSFKGEIKLNEHSAIAWVTISELANYDYPEPDLPIIELLQRTALP
ncbi:(deoxy)nucleoside triphosphate pyrophosphohydrolase [Candidatus Dependentiae bacterium]|nr:(deoxy)nucleoside triphosphate pyrophosphohydrolase [Candidatus Dependentiae bacterium]